jgi:hypothetical protein
MAAASAAATSSPSLPSIGSTEIEYHKPTPVEEALFKRMRSGTFAEIQASIDGVLATAGNNNYRTIETIDSKGNKVKKVVPPPPLLLTGHPLDRYLTQNILIANLFVTKKYTTFLTFAITSLTVSTAPRVPTDSNRADSNHAGDRLYHVIRLLLINKCNPNIGEQKADAPAVRPIQLLCAKHAHVRYYELMYQYGAELIPGVYTRRSYHEQQTLLHIIAHEKEAPSSGVIQFLIRCGMDSFFDVYFSSFLSLHHLPLIVI